MSRCVRPLTLVAIGWTMALPLHHPASVDGAVDLVWRPTSQTSDVDQMVDVRLYAVAAEGENETIAAIQVVLAWDASRLALWGVSDPCSTSPCPPNTYDWMSSGFPNDSNGDGLNNTFLDGNALYAALVPLGTTTPAVATPQGLWVTTFRFQTLSPGHPTIQILATLGSGTRTLVASGDATGVDITGNLGPPTVVHIVGCPNITAAAMGSRYLAVTPGTGPDAVALVVTGDADDPAVSCVRRYVQADGTLGPTPLFQTPDEWGTVDVSDSQVIPQTTYHVQAGCGTGQQVQVLSNPVTVTTWVWGDVDNNGHVFVNDVIAVMDGAQGIIGDGLLPESMDLAPCRPDRQIDAADVLAVQRAFNGGVYPCAAPCQPGPTLEDLAELIPCLLGPNVRVGPSCVRFDANVDGDGDVDLDDFRVFQATFGVLP